MEKARLNSEFVWVIDPLDGTTEFIRGLPYFTISIGLLHQNNPVFGLIHSPVENSFLYGSGGKNLYLNKTKINPNYKTIQNISDIKVCISESEFEDKSFHKFLSHISSKNISIIGSVAYKLSLIAQGKSHLMLSNRSKADWDIAGGAALFDNKSLSLLDKQWNKIKLNKKSFLSNGIIAGNHSAVEIYKKFFKD